MEGGLGGQGLYLPGKAVNQRLKKFRHGFRSLGAHIEKLHGAFPEDFLIVGVKALRGDGLHILPLSQPGNPQGVLPAHKPGKLMGGVELLVVPDRIDGGDEVNLFPFHKVPGEAFPFHHRLQQQLPEEVRHGGKNPVPLQSVGILNKAANEPCGLVVPQPPGNGAHRSAVQIVQPEGDGPQIRGFFRSPEEHRRKQGIQRRFLPGHGAQQLKAEAPLLESGLTDTPEGDSLSQRDGSQHNDSPQSPPC